MSNRKAPAKAVKAFADRAKEASGILILVKPLLNRADKLTEAELDIMETAIRRASSLLIHAESDFYKAREVAEQTATAVRRADSNHLY